MYNFKTLCSLHRNCVQCSIHYLSVLNVVLYKVQDSYRHTVSITATYSYILLIFFADVAVLSSLC